MKFFKEVKLFFANLFIWFKYQFNIGNTREVVDNELCDLLLKANEVINKEVVADNEYDEYEGIWEICEMGTIMEVTKEADKKGYRVRFHSWPEGFTVKCPKSFSEISTQIISYKNDL